MNGWMQITDDDLTEALLARDKETESKLALFCLIHGTLSLLLLFARLFQYEVKGAFGD